MSYSPAVPGRMKAIRPSRGLALTALTASVDEAVAEAAVLAAGLLVAAFPELHAVRVVSTQMAPSGAIIARIAGPLPGVSESGSQGQSSGSQKARKPSQEHVDAAMAERGGLVGPLAQRKRHDRGADDRGVPHPRPARGSGERPQASARRPEATRVARHLAP